MSTVEKDCAYCRQPIRLSWKNGLVSTVGVCLVVDQFFHDKCWDDYLVKYHTKLTWMTRTPPPNATIKSS
jgi:hypothetical protein